MALSAQHCLDRLARRIAARMARYTTADAQACPEYNDALTDMGWLTSLANAIGQKVVVQEVMEELLDCDPDSRVENSPPQAAQGDVHLNLEGGTFFWSWRTVRGRWPWSIPRHIPTLIILGNHDFIKQVLGYSNSPDIRVYGWHYGAGCISNLEGTIGSLREIY